MMQPESLSLSNVIVIPGRMRSKLERMNRFRVDVFKVIK